MLAQQSQAILCVEPMRGAKLDTAGAGGEERGGMVGDLLRRARKSKAAQQVVGDERAGGGEVVAGGGCLDTGQQGRVKLHSEGVQFSDDRQVECHLAAGQGTGGSAVFVHDADGADGDLDFTAVTPDRGRGRVNHAPEVRQQAPVGTAADLDRRNVADTGADRLFAPGAEQEGQFGASDRPAQRVAARQGIEFPRQGRGRATQQVAHAAQRLGQGRHAALGVEPDKVQPRAARATPR